jgi:hypothetical protein
MARHNWKTKTSHFTENDWDNLDGPYLSEYDKAKTLAKRADWDFMEQ